MNRYFYIPVMDSQIKHDGVSLRDHLRVVDYELFQRECKSDDTTDVHSFHDDSELDMLFKERMLPRRIVLVSSEEGFYELGTEEHFNEIPMDYLKPFEISGEEVVDVFVNNLDYPVHVANFFDSYQKNKNQLNEEGKISFGRKVMRKIPFWTKKNS